MAEYGAKRDPNRCPTHPGELLREDVIPATGKTKSEIAALFGISRQHLYDILEERKPVSPAVAVRLGKLFGERRALRGSLSVDKAHGRRPKWGMSVDGAVATHGPARRRSSSTRWL